MAVLARRLNAVFRPGLRRSSGGSVEDELLAWSARQAHILTGANNTEESPWGLDEA